MMKGDHWPTRQFSIPYLGAFNHASHAKVLNYYMCVCIYNVRVHVWHCKVFLCWGSWQHYWCVCVCVCVCVKGWYWHLSKVAELRLHFVIPTDSVQLSLYAKILCSLSNLHTKQEKNVKFHLHVLLNAFSECDDRSADKKKKKKWSTWTWMCYYLLHWKWGPYHDATKHLVSGHQNHKFSLIPPDWRSQSNIKIIYFDIHIPFCVPMYKLMPESLPWPESFSFSSTSV